VEFIFDSDAAESRAVGSLIAEARNQSAVDVKLDLYPLPGITAGEIIIQGNERPLKTLNNADLKPAYSISLTIWAGTAWPRRARSKP
jgi:hypothetical protein